MRNINYNLSQYDYIASGAHTLIGGATGCGKSVLIDTLMYSILTDTRKSILPHFYLIDPKRVSLGKYRRVYSVDDYACEYESSIKLLERVIRHMEQRYIYMQANNQVLINANDVYVVIDELADLLTMPDSRKRVKPLIQRIAQLGRAAKIHLIAATQCPARKIIPAELTLNFTEKIALKCDTAIESRQLIGVPGAEVIREYGIAYMRSKGEVYQIAVPKISDNDIEGAIISRSKRSLMHIV